MKSSDSWTSYKLNIFELEPKNTLLLDNDELYVKTIKLSHRIPCTGFSFKSKKSNSNISYAYCSDTEYFPEISKYLENFNILYHESTFLEKHRDLAKKTKHSTALQASKIALSSNVNKLILGHFSARYKDLNQFKNEAESIFPNTFLAEEGKLYSF